MDLSTRVLRSQHNEKEFEKLLHEYRPYIASAVSRAVGHYVDDHDDVMSIGIIAFSEAVRRFRPESGQFLSFAGQVIKSRLIDDIRTKGRAPQTVSLNDAFAGEENAPDAAFAYSPAEDPLRLEIDALSAVLENFGFRFADVAACSPKHKSTKRDCARAAGCLLESPGLLESLKKTGQLPAKKIREITGLPQKLLERHRKYIMCLAEILSGDYTYLAEYMKFVREVIENEKRCG